MEQSALQVFDFEGQRTRIVMKDGVPWWVGKDVCDILGYINSRKAIEDHCKHASILKSNESLLLDVPTRGLSIIPESDVYRLILRSNLPEAEKFETWLMEEVLRHERRRSVVGIERYLRHSGLNQPSQSC